MRKLTVSKKTFFDMLGKLIASGVGFDSNENENGEIVIEFTGAY